MPEGNDARGEEVLLVPPGEEDKDVVAGMGQASEALGKEAKGRMDKELKALEKVHARHARKAEKAAERAGGDPQALRGELEQLQGQEVSTEEQARDVRRRTQELARKHRPAHAAVLEEAGIDQDLLAQEIMASVNVPDHARALGRRSKTQDGKGEGGKGEGGKGSTDESTDSLGWTTEVEG